MCGAVPDMDAPEPAKASGEPSPPPASPTDPSPLPRGGGLGVSAVRVDVTSVPKELDERALALDPHGGLRATTVTPGKAWTKKAGAALAAGLRGGAGASVEVLHGDAQREEKMRAFDLLDALTRSGSLPLSHATLHVLVCATQSFDDSVVDTVVKRNVNPIERAERSAVVLAGAVHGLSWHDAARSLLSPNQVERVRTVSPLLFCEGDE